MSEFRHINKNLMSANESLDIDQQNKLQNIFEKAIEARDLLEQSGVLPEAILVVAHSLWDQSPIERINCWIITAEKEIHHKPIRYGIEYSVAYTKTTGLALSEAGDIVHYSTDEPIGDNPRLVQFVDTKSEHLNEKGIHPLAPELLLAESVDKGLDDLIIRAIYHGYEVSSSQTIE